MSKKRYFPGEVITDINTLLQQTHICCRGKTVHQGWFRSCTIQYALGQLQLGNIRKAIKEEEAE